MSPPWHPRFLEVRLNDSLCGFLVEMGGVCQFVPSEPFRAAKNALTLSLSMSIPGRPDIGARIFANPFHPALYNTEGRLPPYFAGLLPESELRQRLEVTRHNAADRDDFGILAAAGNDLPGAVVVAPPGDPHAVPDYVRTIGVTGGAEALEPAITEGPTEGAASISGVQNKLALSTLQRGARYTLPGHGRLSDLIAKLPARNDDAQIFNEYVAMQLARAAGVEVAQCEPMPIDAIEIAGFSEMAGTAQYFLGVERFDRRGNERIHSEDVCQALGRMPSAKYAKADQFAILVRYLAALSPKGVDDVRQFFVRQAVNTLLGNSDAHLKNFSVIYPDGSLPQLSPAYDIVCVAALPAFASYGTNVAIDKVQRAQTLANYTEMGAACGVPSRIVQAAVRSAVAGAKARWPALLRNLPAPAGMAEVVLDRLATLPLAREA